MTAKPSAAPKKSRPKPPYPTNLMEFVTMFPSEKACEDYLYKLRWPDGFVCPKCGAKTAGTMKGRRQWQCPRGHQTSITAGTTMHRTKLPLRQWFFAAFMVGTQTPGVSALQFQKQIGLSRYETAFQLLHKLRSAFVAPDRQLLRGEVEVNEGWLGGPEEGHPGRGAVEKTMILLAVEILRWKEERRNPKTGELEEVERRRAGRVRIGVIPNGQKRTLLPWIEATIEKGSTIITDGLSSYRCLPAAGYAHKAVIPEQGDPASYLYMAHLIMSNVKAWWLGTFHGSMSRKHMPAYLNEYAFRFNRRFWPGAAFHRALGLAMHAEDWPEYETLYATGKKGGWEHPAVETDPYTLDC